MVNSINKKKNGEYYWESASLSPIKNENGIISHILAVKEDITERKKAEEASLSTSQQMLRTVLDTIPQRVFWKDRHLSFVGCNKSLAMDSSMILINLLEKLITKQHLQRMQIFIDWMIGK